MDLDAPTPIEELPGGILAKREDLWTFGIATGAKSRTMIKHHNGAPGIITGGTRISPQMERASAVGKVLGVPVRIHTGGGSATPEMQYSQSLGAQVIQHAPGYLTQVAAGLRRDGEARPDWQLWPFGMGRQEYVDDVAIQAQQLPFDKIGRIVCPCGSGMTLAGIIKGLEAAGVDIPIVGISVGASPFDRLNTYAPRWRERTVDIFTAALKYEQYAKRTTFGHITLDRHYEAKAIDFLRPGDLLWIVGLRNSQTKPTAPPPTMPKAPKAPKKPKHPPATPPAEKATEAATDNTLVPVIDQAHDDQAHDPIPATEDRLPLVRCAHTRLVPITELRPHPRNPNTHPPEQIRLLAKIIENTGFRNPITVSNLSGNMVKGHGRLQAAQLLHYTHVPVDFQDYDDPQQELEDLIADNTIAELASINRNTLNTLLAELATAGRDSELAGILKAHSNQQDDKRAAAGALKTRFIISPFTTIDARSGDFLERKKLWLQLGLTSENGRSDNLIFANSSQPPAIYNAKNAFEAKIGRACTWDEFFDHNPQITGSQQGTSIFNPVLCEVLYNWFLPTTGPGAILDPFAGGSVRGIVAAFLGHDYTGIELRQEQIDANLRNLADIYAALGENAPTRRPKWILGDSSNLKELIHPSARFDLIFTCPPYGDLEVYSDDPKDLSNMPLARFNEVYTGIIQTAQSYLRPQRFSIWIVGDYRDKKTSNLVNFVNTTITAHEPAAKLYNHAIFLTPAGSLAIRTSKSFPPQRKLGKTHQDAVITYNGDRLQLEALTDAAVEHVLIHHNGESKKITDALGPLSARDIVPLGDILEQLTRQA